MATINTTDPKPGYVYNSSDDTWYPLLGLATQSLDGLTDVVITTPTSGQILAYNGTQWINQTETGDVTAVTSGTGISVTNSTGPIPSVAVDTAVVATTNNTLTFSGKTIALGSNTVSGTIADFNTALTDGDFATLAGSETLTGKTISGTSNTITNVSLTTGVTGTLPVANGGTGITSFGTGIATFLGTPSSANLASALTDETGSGSVVFATGPTMSGVFLTGTTDIQQVLEKATVTATAATGTVNYNLLDNGSVTYYTSNSTGNWTLNVRGSSSTSLNTVMATGESMTLAFLVTNGSPAYYQTGFQIDGNAVTPKWQGGTAPTSGNTNSIDIYTITIIKTAASTFTALAAQTKFA